MSGHVTEEQITDMIVDGQVPAHVTDCADCRARVDAAMADFSGATADFSAATLAWSAAQPRRIQMPAARGVGFRLMPAALGLAMAAAVFVALPAWQERAAMEITPQDSSAQIADDDALLQQVNVALAQGDASPLDEYHLGGGSR